MSRAPSSRGACPGRSAELLSSLRALWQGPRPRIWRQAASPGTLGKYLEASRSSPTAAPSGSYGMNSHNHPVLGAVSGWMFRWLAGVRVDESQPGYRHFWVAPETPALLNHAGAEIETMRGRLSSRWERRGQGFALELTVPPSSEATVIFPGREGENTSVREGGAPLGESPFTTPGAPDARTGRATARAKSGAYRFEIG